MSWNYRVLRHNDPTDRPWYAIHEVYFDDMDRIWGCTEEAVAPGGESFDDLRADLLMFVAALINDNVLDYDSIPEPGAVNPMELDNDRP